MSNEYQLCQEHAAIEASSGVLCRGQECGGWFVTPMDTWDRCVCGGDKPHPEDYEASDYEGEIWENPVTPADATDDLPF
jgi:hypothetical protein